MKKVFVAIALFSILAGVRELYGEIAGSISWKKDYKAGRYTDPYDIKIDNDGYYVSIAFADDRTWLLKLDPETGDTVLSRFYNGHPYALAIDHDNNYVIVATRGGYDIYIDAVITKVNSRTGDIIWQRIYGDNEIEDKLLDIAVLSNGDYIGVGLKEKSVLYDRIDVLWIVYIDSETGDTLYARRYDDLAYSSIGFTVTVSRLGNVYVGGRLKRTSQSPSDGFILKIDEKTGKITWKKLVGSIKDDNVFDIMFDPLNRLVGVGSYVDPRKNEYVGWIFTMNPRTGKILGKRQFDGTKGPSETHFTRVAWNPQTKSYVVGGNTRSVENDKNYVAWILNLDPHFFTIIWEQRIENENRVRAVTVDGWGRTAVAGFKELSHSRDSWFAQLSHLGSDVPWFRIYHPDPRKFRKRMSFSKASHLIIDSYKTPQRIAGKSGEEKLLALGRALDGLWLIEILSSDGSISKEFFKKGEEAADFDFMSDHQLILASTDSKKKEAIIRRIKILPEKFKEEKKSKIKNMEAITIKKINDSLIILVGYNTNGMFSIVNLDKNLRVKNFINVALPEKVRGINIDTEKPIVIFWGKNRDFQPFISLFDYSRGDFLVIKVIERTYRESELDEIYKVILRGDTIMAFGFTALRMPGIMKFDLEGNELKAAGFRGNGKFLTMRLACISDSTYTIVATQVLSKTIGLTAMTLDNDFKLLKKRTYGLIGLPLNDDITTFCDNKDFYIFSLTGLSEWYGELYIMKVRR